MQDMEGIREKHVMVKGTEWNVVQMGEKYYHIGPLLCINTC